MFNWDNTQITYKETVYETVATKISYFYATNSSRIWELLAEKEKDKKSGISDVWLLPPIVPNAKEVTKENIKDVYSIKLIFDHQELKSEYSIKKGKEMESIIGTILNDDEYCVEVRFNLLEFDKIKIGQKTEKSSEFKSYVFKHKNFFYVGISSAFSNVHIIWDCVDTDISSVTPFSSIHKISEPKSLHPTNKKYSITSHTPGLPGHYALFVWRFNDPTINLIDDQKCASILNV